MNRVFLRLGFWVVRHPWRVLGLWVLISALGAIGSHRLAQVAVGGEGGVPGSPSRLAGDALRLQFTNPFLDPLMVAVTSRRLRVDEAPYASWLRQSASRLAALPEVRRVASYSDSHDAHLRSADGHATMLLVGLAASDNAGQQRGVIAVRAALEPLRAQLLQLDPSAREAVTGGAAADFDVNAWSAAGGDRAEERALPLTLLILAIAFGTLVAASLPFLMGARHHDGFTWPRLRARAADASLESAWQRGHHDRACDRHRLFAAHGHSLP
jgi:RND superfamily putative drug exporter